MADNTPSRLGQINGSGDADATFLKVFGGEVLASFDEYNVMFGGKSKMATHLVKTIQHGKSAAFPVLGKASASYHTPGAEITGGLILQNEKIINIDGLCTASYYIADIDDAKNHYDVRAPFSNALGQALAIKADKQILQVTALAARSSATVTGGYGGSVLTNAGYDTTADTLVQGIFDAGQKLDEKDVPEGERYCVLPPKHYNLVVQSSKAINRDWNAGWENGSVGEGKVFKVNGIIILKSNHVPSTNVAAESGVNNTYHGDFSNTVCTVFHSSAIGTLKLIDLKVEMAYRIETQGTQVVAKYAMGHGILRPEGSVELKKA